MHVRCMHIALPLPYITHNPKKAPSIDKSCPRDTVKLLPPTNATALDFPSWVEDGPGEFPPLPPEVLVVGDGGLLMPLEDPWGWGAEAFGDDGCGEIVIGTWEGDGDGVFSKESLWTEITIFWPRQQ